MLLTQAAIVIFSRTTVRLYHKFKARSRGTCPSYKDSMHVGYNLIIAIIYIASSVDGIRVITFRLLFALKLDKTVHLKTRLIYN